MNAVASAPAAPQVSGPMRARRRCANFLIKDCGLSRLRNSRVLRVIRAIFDEIDLQYIRDSNPCRSVQSRAELYRVAHEVCIGGEPIDYLEFGVFKGESMRQWLDLNRHPRSRFFGFDSFEGLPEDWRPGQAKGHFDVGGVVPVLDDSRVRFVRGWFEDTVPRFARAFSCDNRLVIHIDADLYSSTMLALIHLGPFMQKGTLLIFDEFYDREHEFKALMDWKRIYRKEFYVVAQMENFAKVCLQLA